MNGLHSGIARVVVVWLFVASASHAQQSEQQRAALDPSQRRVTKRVEVPTPAAVSKTHPLAGLITYALQEQAYLQKTVRDFTCRVTKRERIDDELQPYHIMKLKVREELRRDNEIIQPFSVFIEFLAPAKVAGRKVLYVRGQNGDKMLVRNGGRRFEYVVAEIDPLGEAALKESTVPISEIGFHQMLNRLIRMLEEHVEADPTGGNTKVDRLVRAKINDRPCTVVRVTHPEKQEGLHFHRASVYVDDELHVPVRLDAYDWPEKPGDEPPLLAEYTYTELRLNVGLADADFNPAQLRAPARRATAAK